LRCRHRRKFIAADYEVLNFFSIIVWKLHTDNEAKISKRETLVQELEALVSKCNLCLLLLDGFLSFLCEKGMC
jgi:hypothetical protein